MGAVDPVRDREVIEFELAIADLASLEKRLDKTRRSARTGDKEALAELPALEKAYGFLKDGRGLWEARLTQEEKAVLAPLTLLTIKPVLYAANVSDSELAGEEAKAVAGLAVWAAHDAGPKRMVGAPVLAALARRRLGGAPWRRAGRDRPPASERPPPGRARSPRGARRAGSRARVPGRGGRR